MHELGGTVDPAEIERFAAQGADWWNPTGSLRLLHQINPVRIDFIRRQMLAHFGRNPLALRPFEGLTLLDIGCGGGLIAEPMTRLGCAVTGVDAGVAAIAAARTHAAAVGFKIDYRVGDVESLAAGGQTFDAILALEVIEHVGDRGAFLEPLGGLVKPGGLFIGATLNRSALSFALAIVGAEYVLGWLPRGTHDWRRFVRPSEFVLSLRRVGLQATALSGLGYDWRRGEWRETADLSVNYMLAAVRR